MSSKHLKYSAKFKLCMVRFAEQSNNCAASREFCVNEKLVRDWRRQVEKLKCMPKNKCADRGKRCQWPDLEENLVKWIEDQRRSGYIVTWNLIRIKAKAMASDQQMSNFQATNSWCTRFLRRRNFVLRQKTKIAQKLPHRQGGKLTFPLCAACVQEEMQKLMLQRSSICLHRWTTHSTRYLEHPRTSQGSRKRLPDNQDPRSVALQRKKERPLQRLCKSMVENQTRVRRISLLGRHRREEGSVCVRLWDTSRD